MKFAIDKIYAFEACKDDGAIDIKIHLQLENEKVKEYGEYFLSEDFNQDEYIDDKIKDLLDEQEVKRIAQAQYEKWKISNNESKTNIDGFNDYAWNYVATHYQGYHWSLEFKNDCIDYYLFLLLKQIENQANQGDLFAQKRMGDIYKYIKSFRLAAKMYKAAALQGDVDSQFNLGDLYNDGKGVKQSYSEAKKWYKRAALQGHTEAQCNMGWYFENGLGVEKSLLEAQKWWFMAADQGSDEAIKHLKKLEIDIRKNKI